MPNKYSRTSSPHFREGRRFPLEGGDNNKIRKNVIIKTSLRRCLFVTVIDAIMLLIKNGKIIDGTGKPPIRPIFWSATINLRDRRFPKKPGIETIDAGVHHHPWFRDPNADSVTTYLYSNRPRRFLLQESLPSSAGTAAPRCPVLCFFGIHTKMG